MTDKKPKTSRTDLTNNTDNVVKVYRIVCHGAGQPGHVEHVFNYPTKDQAVTMRAKRTTEWGRKPDTAPCTPFHLESQMISPWAPEIDDS